MEVLKGCTGVLLLCLLTANGQKEIKSDKSKQADTEDKFVPSSSIFLPVSSLSKPEYISTARLSTAPLSHGILIPQNYGAQGLHELVENEYVRLRSELLDGNRPKRLGGPKMVHPKYPDFKVPHGIFEGDPLSPGRSVFVQKPRKVQAPVSEKRANSADCSKSNSASDSNEDDLYQSNQKREHDGPEYRNVKTRYTSDGEPYRHDSRSHSGRDDSYYGHGGGGGEYGSSEDDSNSDSGSKSRSIGASRSRSTSTSRTVSPEVHKAIIQPSAVRDGGYKRQYEQSPVYQSEYNPGQEHGNYPETQLKSERPQQEQEHNYRPEHHDHPSTYESEKGQTPYEYPNYERQYQQQHYRPQQQQQQQDYRPQQQQDYRPPQQQQQNQDYTGYSKPTEKQGKNAPEYKKPVYHKYKPTSGEDQPLRPTMKKPKHPDALEYGTRKPDTRTRQNRKKYIPEHPIKPSRVNKQQPSASHTYSGYSTPYDPRENQRYRNAQQKPNEERPEYIYESDQSKYGQPRQAVVSSMKEHQSPEVADNSKEEDGNIPIVISRSASKPQVSKSVSYSESSYIDDEESYYPKAEAVTEGRFYFDRPLLGPMHQEPVDDNLQTSYKPYNSEYPASYANDQHHNQHRDQHNDQPQDQHHDPLHNQHHDPLHNQHPDPLHHPHHDQPHFQGYNRPPQYESNYQRQPYEGEYNPNSGGDYESGPPPNSEYQGDKEPYQGDRDSSEPIELDDKFFEEYKISKNAKVIVATAVEPNLYVADGTKIGAGEPPHREPSGEQQYEGEVSGEDQSSYSQEPVSHRSHPKQLPGSFTDLVKTDPSFLRNVGSGKGFFGHKARAATQIDEKASKTFQGPREIVQQHGDGVSRIIFNVPKKKKGDASESKQKETYVPKRETLHQEKSEQVEKLAKPQVKNTKQD